MNVRSKEHYISDENKLKKRLNKRSLYVQSLRTPVVKTNIDDIVGEQIESGAVSIPRPVQQVSNYGSLGGTAKSIVNIINSLTLNISNMSSLFLYDGGKEFIYRDYADTVFTIISKIKILFNELRDTYESFLNSVNPNKKDQFIEIRNSIIKYFEIWNQFYKRMGIKIDIDVGGARQTQGLNEYLYNQYLGDSTFGIISSEISLTLGVKEVHVLEKTYMDINFNYNDTLKIIFDTLGNFVDKIKIYGQKKQEYKKTTELVPVKEQLNKDKNDVDDVLRQLRIDETKLKNEIKPLEDNKKKQIIKLQKLNNKLDVIQKFFKLTFQANKFKKYNIDAFIKDYSLGINNVNVNNVIKNLKPSALVKVNDNITKLNEINLVKIPQINAEIARLDNELEPKIIALNDILDQININTDKLNDLTDQFEKIDLELKTNISKVDYTPKKGSGRGQSIKYISKKGSGRSQYVDPYDRSIPKRYM